jgi:hypothetical protein
VQLLSPASAAVAEAALAAGALDQDAAHRLGGRGEEVATVGKGLIASQAKIGFMHQGRGLEGLPWFLLGELLRCQSAQLLVDQRQQPLGSLGVAVLNGRQDAGDFVHQRNPTPM